MELYNNQSIDETRVNGIRIYEKPSLECLGDLRTLTLGGSPGVGDTGTTYTYEYPYGYTP